METNKVVVNEKWKNVLLTIAMVFQCMKIVVFILATIFQKPLISWMIGQKNYNNHFVIPVQAIITIVLSTIIFFICYIVIKNNKDESHITKEVVCIVLLLPVYYTLNSVLATIGRIAQNFILNNGQYYNNDIYYISVLERGISFAQYVFDYSTLLLVIVAAISIGKKLKNKEM